MSVSILAYMPFIASQFYPRFYTMIPAGLSVGLGGGPLWCAKCTYLTVAAEAYSTVSDMAADVLVTRFFGLFFMFYQMAQVWGNLISSAGGLAVHEDVACLASVTRMLIPDDVTANQY
jgi:hypothetical protein